MGTWPWSLEKLQVGLSAKRLCTKRAIAGNGMFAGRIGEKVVVSDRPILAVDGEQILFAFDNVEDATGFLLKEATDTATIFRHNGRDWDKMDRPDPQP